MILILMQGSFIFVFEKVHMFSGAVDNISRRARLPVRYYVNAAIGSLLQLRIYGFVKEDFKDYAGYKKILATKLVCLGGFSIVRYAWYKNPKQSDQTVCFCCFESIYLYIIFFIFKPWS